MLESEESMETEMERRGIEIKVQGSRLLQFKARENAKWY